ncbi:hypothetical protein M9H77_06818 [Catharanthus roseus]|uniref:Uncharacterized protein n=1 Tax=Catharanthus roseus TaxID=4058 RepID=A0ACC0BTL1_CATRO|nr:hypothetical protein M9H77_06818 [Catharanthus roseus]
MSGRRHTMEFEGQGESVGGKLLLCYGDSSFKPIALLPRTDSRMNLFKGELMGTNGSIQGSKAGRVGSFKNQRGSHFWTLPPAVDFTLPLPVGLGFAREIEGMTYRGR